MIEIDKENKIYVCPFCGCRQSYCNTYSSKSCGYHHDWGGREDEDIDEDLIVYHLKCTNSKCSKITVVGFKESDNEQIDIYPKCNVSKFPDYVPKQIRDDFREAVIIMNDSPKASATLLRRCLQGMIRDFWGIIKPTLKEEIDLLKTKIPASQWAAIDGMRKLGNIGAHMEKDINLIIDIDEGEAQKLASLVELLIKNWYISRHDEQKLCEDIVSIAKEKK